MEQTGKVYSRIENGIGYVTFFHPQSNSLPGKILEKIAEEIHNAGSNKDSNEVYNRYKQENSL